MKVGIITITWGTNYGNRLQNYAVQKICEGMGWEVETFHRKYDNTNNMKLKVKKTAVKIYELQSSFQIPKLNLWAREISFSRFNDKYIHFSDYNVEDAEQDFLAKYDCFIAGGDQIWNPYYLGYDKYAYLNFGLNQKRIAISPSFGVDKLPEKCNDEVAAYLNRFDAVSVREETGADIIYNLTGKRPLVMIDPTMMLPADEWLKIASRPKCKIVNPYVITYFLGNRPIEAMNLIEQLEEKYSLDVIDLPVLDFTSQWHSTGPSEFLWLISNAQCVVTDSFHGTVFSILFEKPFAVADRDNEKISSRINTLLCKFNLEGRKINKIDISNIFEIDFHECRDIVESEREIVRDYLKGCV